MDAATLQEWVSIILTFLGPIVVVILTIRLEKNRKADQKLRELKLKQREEKEKRYSDTLDALSDKIEQLSVKIDAIERETEHEKTRDQDLDEDLRKLTVSHQINGRYIHEVAKLVVVLASGIRDQHLDGNITKAVESYREVEQDLLKVMMTMAPPEDIHITK